MSSLPRTLFRTDAYAPEKRYDAFRETMGCAFDLEKPTKVGDEFYANIETYLVGECAFVQTETVGHI